MAISRDHGLNPSQMRRLAADTVAKVDLVRSEAIANAPAGYLYPRARSGMFYR